MKITYKCCKNENFSEFLRVMVLISNGVERKEIKKVLYVTVDSRTVYE